jgi:ribonucleoside-diphosphate reductase alpha chain
MINETYNVDQLTEAAISYFSGDTLASNVWITKYALKENGKYIEKSPDDTINRITSEIHRMELKFQNPISRKEIYNNLKNFNNFIFGGSILFGLGNKHQISSLGNCFFIDNAEDSYGAIFNLDETMAQIMKRRGGVGITIENLRPSGSLVNNSAQSSTGAVSFMNRYSSTTKEVAQDGRRGALMISGHINHPDSPEIIIKKDDVSKLTGANISLKVTDEFMKAVETDQDYILHWPTTNKQPTITEQLPYNQLYKKEDGTYIKRVKAKEIWDSLIHQAHKNAEPGVLFWDNIIKESPADCYADEGFTTKGTNPCGEVPLSASDSCRLGSINLSNIVKNDYKRNAKIDWKFLENISRFAQRVMDDIVSLEEEKILAIIKKIKKDPEPEYLKIVELSTWENVLNVLRKGRRTGIGVLGLGDMLAKLGIQYGSKKATKLIDRIFEVIAVNCYKETVNLAKERGTFPIWDYNKEANNPFLIRVISNKFNNKEYDDYVKNGRRNIALLSIAPTGSLAIEARTTSGIEPVAFIKSLRRKKVNPNDEETKIDFIDQNGDKWKEYNVFHYEFVTWFAQSKYSKNLSVKAREGLTLYLNSLSDDELDKLILKSPWANSESHNIDYIEKVKMQGVIQKWIDHSISVTHNLPENISKEKVKEIYYEAWKAGCKGCTIYREGSRTGVILSKKNKDEEFLETNAPKRPKVLEADYYTATASGRDFAVIIGLWPGTNRPYEVFAFENPSVSKNCKGQTIKIKKGLYKFINGEFEIEDIQLAVERIEQKTLTLTASMLLRHGAPVKYVIKIIKKIDENVTSFSSVVRRYLSRYIDDEVQEDKCPKCGGSLIREEGCIHCNSCSYSKCG